MCARCYLCEKETDKLYPTPIIVGKFRCDAYVCKECKTKAEEGVKG